MASVVPPERILDEVQLHISLKLRPEDVAELGARFYGLGPDDTPNRRQLRALAEQIYESRRIRGRMISDDLFGEPAWDMLLALYFMPAKGKELSVTSLSHAACTRDTTGLRYQARMKELGLIERDPSGRDQRKVFVRLTVKGEELIEAYLKRIFSAFRLMPPPVSLGLR
jgi:DNA-binding MarR family transcriptional regulator